MTADEFGLSIRRLYILTALAGAVGFVSLFAVRGARFGFGFALGVLASILNLWLWDWLSRAISPEGAKSKWQAGLFIGRYIILWGFGYAIVKGLGVDILAAVLGLLASTVAVLISMVIEIVQGFLHK